MTTQGFTPIYRSQLTAGGASSDRAPTVTYEEFQDIARKGKLYLESYYNNPNGYRGILFNWEKTVNQAYKKTRSPWGGYTVDAASGFGVYDDEDAYALSARLLWQPSPVSVSIDANREEFGQAMDAAFVLFRDNLEASQHYLGVFHDADAGRIEIDPVIVTEFKPIAEAIGAYTRNVGGAYHFKSGNGYWPPSIKD